MAESKESTAENTLDSSTEAQVADLNIIQRPPLPKEDQENLTKNTLDLSTEAQGASFDTAQNQKSSSQEGDVKELTKEAPSHSIEVQDSNPDTVQKQKAPSQKAEAKELLKEMSGPSTEAQGASSSTVQKSPPQRKDREELTKCTCPVHSTETQNVQKQNTNSQNEDVDELIKKVRQLFLPPRDIPFYLKELINRGKAARKEYKSTLSLEKKVEYSTLYEAIEYEVQLQQFRTYRLRHNKKLPYTETEIKLFGHLAQYIEQQFKESVKYRRCYLATKDKTYEEKYNGTKSALKILMDAQGFRRGYDFMVISDCR